MDKDVTHEVEFGSNDDEFLPLTKCACGKRYALWEITLSIYSDDPYECEHCGRKLYFKIRITVYEKK